MLSFGDGSTALPFGRFGQDHQLGLSAGFLCWEPADELAGIYSDEVVAGIWPMHRVMT